AGTGLLQRLLPPSCPPNRAPCCQPPSSAIGGRPSGSSRPRARLSQAPGSRSRDGSYLRALCFLCHDAPACVSSPWRAALDNFFGCLARSTVFFFGSSGRGLPFLRPAGAVLESFSRKEVTQP